MANLNAKVGCETISDTVGPYGLGDVNDRGEKLIEWAQINQLVISNTWFKQPLRWRWTWKKPGTGERKQIDYIMISKRFRNALMIAKSAPGANCYSDHIPVISHLRLKLKKRKQAKTETKRNLALLKTNLDLRQKYRIKVQNKFEALEGKEEIKLWEQLKNSITEATEEEIPKKERKAKQKWMTDDILELMDRRRLAKGDQQEYERLHKEVRRRCEEAKECWLNEKCQRIDLLQSRAPNEIYKNIEELVGRKQGVSTRSQKTKNGDIIMDKEKIQERQSEYIQELFDDERKDIKVMKNNFAGPTTMKDEKITILLNEIYDTGHIPKDMLKSVFISLPKKAGATECELHRTINLMSHVTKILLRIIMMRVRNKIRPEIAEEQCGFVE